MSSDHKLALNQAIAAVRQYARHPADDTSEPWDYEDDDDGDRDPIKIGHPVHTAIVNLEGFYDHKLPEDGQQLWRQLLVSSRKHQHAQGTPRDNAYTFLKWLRDESRRISDAGEVSDLVTLDQAAALVGKSKRTLERWKLPDPDYPGGGGKPHRWKWQTIRPALLRERPNLPECFPGSRIV